MLAVTKLRCNHMDSPLAVGPEPPWLSWRIEAGDGEREVRQASCRVVVPGVWDSGAVDTSSPWLEWGGPTLTCFKSYPWTVSLELDDGQVVKSQPASFETGPLSREDWSARWITLPRPRDQHDDHRPAPQLRRIFHLDTVPVRARLYITAGGVYRAYLNGTRIGEDELAPGWTDFRRRVHYQAYDVTSLLMEGDNTLAALVADGWYSGAVGPAALGNAVPGTNRALYGHLPCLLAELAMWAPNGSRSSIASGEAWEGAFGEILAADLLMGEVHDARRNFGPWSRASVVDGPVGRLVGQSCSPPRVVEKLEPVKLSEPVAGSYVFDLGQNIVGHTRLRLRARPGSIVRLRHGEMLDASGNLYTENIRGARATDTYVAAGSREEVFEPAFTFHGFRHVEVTGLPEPPQLDDLRGVVVSSAAVQTGSFECSNPMLNRLQHNIRWGQLGNFVEVPTDCPQRDERLGWMGDAQVFAPTACFNADVAAFFGKWLSDLSDTFDEKGFLTDVAPLPKLAETIDLPSAAPGWGDAGVIVPWVSYQWYGDRRLLERAYPLGTAWVDRIRDANPDLLWKTGRGFDFGDWLSLDAETSKELLGTAYFAHSASLVAKIADELAYHDAAESYSSLATNIATAFRDAYVEDGRVSGGTQTAYVLALQFDLLLPEQRERAASYLAADIEKRGNRLTTGFLGVSQLLPALSENGYLDLAYRLLLTDHYPSWGYQIRHGATTIWERWDGWTEERGFQDPGMNSFNHYCFGSVGQWMYSVIGGLRADPASPGWGRVIVEPRPGGGIEWARCRYESVRGAVSCEWHLDGQRLAVEVEIPPTAEAEVRLPCASGASITASGRKVDDRVIAGGCTHIALGSGRYSFIIDPAPAA